MRKRLIILAFLLVIVFGCTDRLVYDNETKFVAEIPTLEPPHAIFTEEDSLIVAIHSETADAVIRYTVDGSKPTDSSPVYNEPFAINRTKIVRAIATKAGLNNSKVAVGKYIKSNTAMVFVEGGVFNLTDHYEVKISSFFMGIYEVTQAEFLAVMGHNPSNFRGNPDNPVEMVSWFDAIEYCNRLSIAESLEPCYSLGNYGKNPDNWLWSWNSDPFYHILINCDWNADGYRLPTLAEWNFAFSGGIPAQLDSTFNTPFSGSENIDDVGWYFGNSQGSTQPVGRKAPNELGIYDMTGNVWEWIWDRNGNPPKGSYTDPRGPKTGDFRIFFGGGWSNSAQHIRDYFYAGLPVEKDKALGFRICRKL